MKKFFAAGTLVGLAVGFYLTPFYSLRQMQHAAKTHDATTLNRYVDYPALRESLKTSLQGEMSKALLQDKTDNGMNAFAKMFATAFVNPLVDTLVTSESVALMLRANMPKSASKNQPSEATPSSKADNTKNATEDEKIITNHHYQDFNHFVVTVAKPQFPKAVFTFTLSRDGFLSWKLTGIAIPAV